MKTALMALRLHLSTADTMTTAAAVQGAESDEALAARAGKGSRSAFVTLVERYQARVYRLVVRMLRNPSDAEEVTQDAFLRAQRGIAFFRGESRFGTWLYRIAVNQALMRQRSSRRHRLQSIDLLLPDVADGAMAGSADDLISRKELACSVYSALEELDEDHRAALVLRDLEELSAEQAAEVLGISADAVRQRAHRARIKLRSALSHIRA